MAANSKEGTDFHDYQILFFKKIRSYLHFGLNSVHIPDEPWGLQMRQSHVIFFFKQHFFWRSVCFIPSVLFSLFRLTLQVIPIPCTSLCQLTRRMLGLILWKRSVLYSVNGAFTPKSSQSQNSTKFLKFHFVKRWNKNSTMWKFCQSSLLSESFRF